jgi:hypothetical protein
MKWHHYRHWLSFGKKAKAIVKWFDAIKKVAEE